ncbi:hypothetical protein CesoFtcFv8_010653 [Champsocephalus esox]|uniref:THAP domain-containing protein 1 n=1 Tax=Champsocephalus esox TaxID=159716 RepID=A0AAN8GZZ0_9TELE|nr:hypothetical protein CesoFtcFv8_010653 [Champsocephalus esox]
MFLFPKDEDLSKAWAKQVQRTRKDWEPTKDSVLCSEHFTRDSVVEHPESALLRAQMGIATKRTLILKEGAIPTVSPRVGTSAVGQLSTSTSRLARFNSDLQKVEELLAESEVESSSFASTEESMEMATDTDMAPE